MLGPEHCRLQVNLRYRTQHEMFLITVFYYMTIATIITIIIMLLLFVYRLYDGKADEVVTVLEQLFTAWRNLSGLTTRGDLRHVSFLGPGDPSVRINADLGWGLVNFTASVQFQCFQSLSHIGSCDLHLDLKGIFHDLRPL